MARTTTGPCLSTPAVPPTTQVGASAPQLGSAAFFAVLGGQTVTNTGPATVSQFYDSLDFATPVVTPYYTQNSLWAVYNNTPVPPASTYTTTNTTQEVTKGTNTEGTDHYITIQNLAYGYGQEVSAAAKALFATDKATQGLFRLNSGGPGPDTAGPPPPAKP